MHSADCLSISELTTGLFPEFHRLLDFLPTAAYTCDVNGLITHFNRHAVAVWGREPALNDPMDRFCGSFKLFMPDGSPITHEQCWMARALKDNCEYRGCEIVVERPDGSRRTALAHANPFRDTLGVLTGAVNVLEDITERKRAEDELREADRKKDEFLAILAHELRNPLAPISNALQLLQRDGVDSAIRDQAREMMERQVDQVVRLVDDLMDVSYITRNQLVLRKQRTELIAVVQSAVEACRPFIERRGHRLQVALPPQPVYLDADAARLAQVFCNLLNNAAKYTDRGGCIQLSLQPEAGAVVIKVRDDGVGIAADMLEKIFESFTQLDRSLERAQGGLGIGLSLVRGLVRMHGGTVEARSDGPGAGSEFLVRLPVTSGGKRGGPHTGKSTVVKAADRVRHRILVVDDNKDAAVSTAMLLKLMGHETCTAHDGLDAVEAALAFKPDVVLLDLGLPRLNGYDAARRIREQSAGAKLLLIAMTGRGREDDKRRSVEAGCDVHLVKPVDPAALESLFEELICNPGGAGD